MRIQRLSACLAAGLLAVAILSGQGAADRPARAEPLAQPSPRPTIDLTATALAQPTAPPPPPGTLPPGPGTTSIPPASPTQPAPTRAAATATATATQTNTAAPSDTPPATATTGPSQTPVVLIQTVVQTQEVPIVQTVVVTNTPAAAAGPVDAPRPPGLGFTLLLWLFMLVPLLALMLGLIWLWRQRFLFPGVYPMRGRPWRGGRLPGRQRR